MPASRPERDALLQRLQADYPDVSIDTDHDIILWHRWRIHCGPLPSNLTPPATLLELCQLWPTAPLGSGLLLAGQQEAVTACQPLWQTLSQQPHAWLYCGPSGAAGFCKRIFDSLFYIASPALVHQAMQSQGASQQPDWVLLLQQHQQLANHLQQLCWQYLQRHGVTTLPQDATTLLSLFRVPPQQQSHYALTLAQLMAVALTLSEPARQLLAEWRPLPTTASST